ncbi:MAG: gliding motility-associated C-terminal domain-containing protein [Bacteroidetes bacterium]|nr:gliding motility-associated C-terminal domain-containing protein [Bacteroidota bacterium]
MRTTIAMKKYFFLPTLLFFASLYVFAKNNTWNANPCNQKVFIENKGQFDSESKKILFASSQGGVGLFFKSNGLIYKYVELVPMTEEEKEKIETPAKKNKYVEEESMIKQIPHYLSVEWLNANPNVQTISEEPVSFYYSYGKNTKASAYKKIIYKNLYPNIDAVYEFPEGKEGVKYSLILHPGANPSDVKMKWSGKISSDASGNITIKSSFGNFIDHAPVSYYENGEKIGSSFELAGNIVSFKLQTLNLKLQTIIIDPWTTNPTFNTNNKAYEVAYDNAGNVYAYGAGAAASTPHQLAKFNSAGALQWIYSATSIASYQNDFGDFTVDKNTGNCYVAEQWAGNSGYPTIMQISTNGMLMKSVFYNNTTNKKAVFEFQRLEFNDCNQTIVCGTGGLPNSSGFDNTQAVVFDLNLNTVVNQTSVVSTIDGVDVQLLAIDKYSCCQYGYILTDYNTYTGNKCRLVKMAMAGLSSVWNIPTQHKFAEAYSALYKATPNVGGPCNGAGCSNGYNGIAVSPTYVYTYDSDSICRWDKNSGALVASAHVSSTAPSYSSCWFNSGAIEIHWGGLDVDECDNTYVGVGKAIKVYDLSFNLINTYNLPDTVYDLHLAPNNKLYASGKGFVTEINNTVATSSTTYSVTVSSTPSSGCSACNGTANVVATATVTCGAPPVFSYSWAPGGQTTTAISNLCPGNYTVTVTSNCFPVSTQTVVITGGSIVVATATASPTTCGNNNGSASVTVTTGTAPYTYSWSPSGGTSSAISNLAAGNYTVTVTDAGGCSAIQTVSVAPSTGITATAGPNPTICAGQSATISATGGGTYWWTNGNTNSSIIISPASSTTYSVIVTTNGCTDTASAMVTVNPLPTVTVPNTTICIGGAATLTASGGTSYSWSNGSTSNPISVNPPSTTTYIVVGTNASGCSGSASVTVSVSPPPIASAISATICSGQSAALTASGGGNYLWNTGNTNSSIIVSPTATSNYSVVVSIGSCADTAKATVTVNPAPSVSLGNNQTLCDGQNLTLNAGNTGASYVWSTGETTQTINISSVGNYWVIVAFGNCLAMDTVNTFSAPGISLFDSSLCTTSPIVLDPGSGATSYYWSTGNTTQTISTDTAGTYYVTAMFGNCAATAIANIHGMPGGEGTLYVPNAFTPNGDHLNEIFLAKGEGIVSFNMNIFDRWGNLIFASDDVNKGWDGIIQGGHYTLKKDGQEVSQEDVYVWKINYTTQCFPKKSERMMGHLSLVK